MPSLTDPGIHRHHEALEINGKTIDDLELETAGYKREMPRQFSTFSLMGLSFALTCTWSGTGSSFGIGLMEGGPAGVIWSLLPAALMTAVLSAGMAELASAYPVAGAQYYWSFMVSSEKHRAFAAYLNGWMSVIGWWLGLASVANFIASMILSIAVMWYPDYTIQHYQQWLVYVLITWLAFVVNVFGSRIIPFYNKFIMVLSWIVMIATIITILACSRHQFPTGTWVFGHTLNSTGWKSDGFAFMLCINNAVYAFLGTDCGAHMCEEIPNPSRNVPKVIMVPIALGLLTAWPFAVACMAGISDLDAIMNSASGVPLIDIFYQGTGGSKAGATVLITFFAFCFFGCMVATGTTSSRTLWAVSRDNALPYSHLWAQVHPTWHMPVNAMGLTATAISIYGLIFLGSTSVFSSMVGTAIVFLQTSCAIPQAILLFRGRQQVLPPRYFSLGDGWFGYFINGLSVLWVCYVNIVYCIPSALPVTAEGMNYVSVVFVGLVSFFIGLWFVSKRDTFKGPRVDYEKMRLRREEALRGVILEDDGIITTPGTTGEDEITQVGVQSEKQEGRHYN
ncbi:MAG: hypothetical protein M1834_006940 [Cirrosporium novae-zelandiae]|nr:MAG: hypothetical protein M1834_006940 [Cirrosporium novae-zelandiae]